MSLNEIPEMVQWPETHYVFVEKVGPFMQNAPAAWGEAHEHLSEILKSNKVVGYMSLYEAGPQIYRAGLATEAAPADLPSGMQYELFAGGKYTKFTLTGPYSQLPEASGRVFDLVQEQGIVVREGFNIENYVKDPRTTPAEELITEILVPTA